jgi:hypothetical protein
MPYSAQLIAQSHDEHQPPVAYLSKSSGGWVGHSVLIPLAHGSQQELSLCKSAGMQGSRECRQQQQQH